jgi:hypothetical protein
MFLRALDCARRFLPEWLLWLAACLGTVIAGALAKLGYGRGVAGTAVPEKPASVAAIVVDMESLHKLTAAIEGHSIKLIEGKRALIIGGEVAERVADQLSEELRNLQREVRELAREVARKS